MTKTITINATELRAKVIANRFESNRLNADSIGADNYRVLTTMYRDALDALTLWASKDYAHTSTKEDMDACFTPVKAILSLFDTDENHVIIDQISMRSMRDCATKPKRLYSAEYTAAMKALKNARATCMERGEDLSKMGIPAITAEEPLNEYAARIRALGVNTMRENIDMLELFVNAAKTLVLKNRKIDAIRAAGHYAWKRPVAVSLNEFAELIENYVGDCLEDGYNIKPSATVRAEKAAERAAKKAASANA